MKQDIVGAKFCCQHALAGLFNLNKQQRDSTMRLKFGMEESNTPRQILPVDYVQLLQCCTIQNQVKI